ncbi:hypothetical protein [Brevibacterium marinum]|uniref:DNA modification methylase n=1 Tax=Brevibacterium marinum TaxID=418643 RepID=A0A846RZC5_9MICO|nr:hypothetical protein [Brevibacterium marinum]NJC56188.1 hypothetical protein [Brevibacterium marinum]
MKRHNRAALAVAALALVIPVSGCASLLSPHQTAEYQYNAGDGAWGTVGDVEVRGLMLIMDESGEGPAQLFFTLINKGDSTASVSVEVGGNETKESVKAGESFIQDPESSASDSSEPIVVDDLDAGPGDLADVTVKVGDDERTIRTQVLTNALPYYEEYVPSEKPSESPSDDATQSGEPSEPSQSDEQGEPGEQGEQEQGQPGEQTQQEQGQQDESAAGVNG